ncbi:MAG TPA: alcohol dehydrogenase catalytic domain-containing protein [Armatimonadota bacterium]|jgi:threonine dehydrogenase-like Zn-dependent dehydrogenase
MQESLPETQYAVQLVGPGKLTLNTAKEVFRPVGRQILACVEAVGLCFSDLKLLKQFEQHVRKGEVTGGIAPDILAALPSYVPGAEPTVPGHEVVCRVAAIGGDVQHYRVGDRFIVQADYRALPTHGSNGAFGYNFEGALQEFVLLDERIMADEAGNPRYTIPVADDLGSAAVALVEPWACVECSYVTRERQGLLSGGRLLVVSETETAAARSLGAPVTHPFDIRKLPDEAFDDIVYFGAEADVIEALNDKLAAHGIINIVLGGRRIGRKVNIGFGRIHYGPTRWIGTASGDPMASYGTIPATGEVRPNDRIVIIGAGGPMGQMHVIRDVTSGLPGISLVAADMDDARLGALTSKARPMAEGSGVPYRTQNTARMPLDPGFTYYALMAPLAPLAAEAVEKCAEGAIINIFAGIPAPVKHEVDLDALIEKRVFLFGTSGSETDHMRIVLGKVTQGRLQTEASVDAVCGMAGATEGLSAVENRTLAGKIIVYPTLHDLPLTPLSHLPDKYPSVAALLKDGRWTREAEDELLRVAR